MVYRTKQLTSSYNAAQISCVVDQHVRLISCRSGLYKPDLLNKKHATTEPGNHLSLNMDSNRSRS